MTQNQTEREFSLSQKKELLHLCYCTIEQYLENGQIPDYTTEDPDLLRLAAVFVTFRIGNRLRGCVGQIQAELPLYKAVQKAAISAAFSDPRFHAISSEEIPNLKIKIAVLSPLEEIEIDHVEIGKHGLVITDHEKRGLLLPEVAAERGWDKITYLENLTMKAGLPKNSWKKAKLFGFSTTIIE